MIELFKYQKEGVEWLYGRKTALLADEMGLGKSAQAIVAADKAKCERILVICPAVARTNWLREFQKFSHFPRNFILVSHVGEKINQRDSVIISYDMLNRVPNSVLGVFSLIIIDEVHYAKNTNAKRTRKIFGKEGIIHGQTQPTKIWGLSGTPIPNHAGEIWPLLYTFGATGLSYADFVQRFCVLTKKVFGNKVQSTISGTKRSEIPELRRLLAKVMLRRTKEIGMLPDIFYSDIVVEAGHVDLELDTGFVTYVIQNRVDELEAKLASEIFQVTDVINTKNIRYLEGMAKSVSTLRRYMGIQKVEKVAEMVKQELTAKLYNKVVIFGIHQAVIEGLRVRLKDFNPVTLYGGSKFNTAHSNIDKFQNNPKCQVFIANITAAGIAINLTAAHNVIMCEQEWTPAKNQQAIARCHRTGQTKPVSVRFVGLANSLDEKISKILKKKTEELTMIFDKNRSPDTKEEIDDLLS